MRRYILLSIFVLFVFSLYSVQADPVVIEDGSVTAPNNLTVDGDTLFVDPVFGRVGIGTLTPQAGLDVDVNSGLGVSSIIVNDNDAEGPMIELRNVNNTVGYINYYQDNRLSFGSRLGTELVLDVATNRVGVGTGDPQSIFHVYGSDAAIARFETSTEGLGGITGLRFFSPESGVATQRASILWTEGSDYVEINSYDADIVFNAGTGSVGINTSNPSYPFDVNTDVLFRQNVGINGVDQQIGLSVNTTDALRIPVGSAAERPAVGQTGYLRYNSDNNVFEGHNQAGWTTLGFGVYAGKTPGTTTADFGAHVNASGKVGYEAGDAICHSIYAGSHLCSGAEISYTIATANLSAFADWSGNAWIATGPAKFTPALLPVNDCEGFTNGVPSNNMGNWWSFDVNGGGVGKTGHCGNTLQIACCR